MSLPALTAKNSTTVRSFMIRHGGGLLSRLAIHLAPRWTARQAVRRFLTPPRRTVAPPHDFPTPCRQQLLNAGAQRVVCRVVGPAAAPALILSHGWGGNGGQWQPFVAPLLAAGYQLWIPEHPAHGDSPGEQSSLLAFVASLEATAAAIAASGVRLAGLIGHSLGASAAALALYGRQLPGTDAGTRLLLLAPAASLQALSRQYAELYGLPETLRAAVQFRLEQQFATPWRSFELAELPAGAHAALLIHDRNDRALAVGHTLHIGQHWPRARILLTEGLGHQRLLQAAPVIAATLAYLRGEEVGAPATPASVSRCY